MMKLKHFLTIGLSVLFFVAFNVTEINAQSTKGSVIKKNSTSLKSNSKAAKTLSKAELQKAYEANLVKDWGKEINKRIISQSEFDALTQDQKNALLSRSNTYMIVQDPVAEAKNYFNQKKSN